ncbi:CBS domain-containing protein [Sphaerobacter sp.]|uniref:CBS domain-containing protein n=1 Tax=Sphaerobacter sp. TaxID=2099654 RepID=UPI001D6762D4|nr:CBS domain-containing protein [Sphaerobacter sp.]MBX5445561.1 CBS domain-containing protein [Sphaerobacter sp.]
MVEEMRVSDVIVPEVDTIGPDETVRTARRRMEAQAIRSLIVVDEDRPVGVIQWRDIMRDNEVPADAAVADYMVREFPVLNPDLSLVQARSQLGEEIDFDRLPVVDESGHLIGEVPRTALSQVGEVMESAPAAEEGASTETWTTVREEEMTVTTGRGAEVEVEEVAADEVAFPTIGAGMVVKGANGRKLGTVDQVIVDSNGDLTAFTVQHGLFGRKHKRIPADLVGQVEDDAVVLSIAGTEFNMLPDVEDEG